jgi:rRNA maturation protein Nop10
VIEDTPSTEARRPALVAHSLAEAHFYLMVKTCEHCGQGPLRSAASLREPGRGEGLAMVTLQAKCSHCGEESWFLFEIPEPGVEGGAGTAGHRRRINPTEEPSRILDVPQWVTLYQIVVNAADRMADKSESRELRFDAAECLDEALRFYQADSDLPPPEALFSDQSRQRLKDHPELYIRQALLAKREVLPSRDANFQLPTLGKGGTPDSSGSPAPAGRRWWRFWR